MISDDLTLEKIDFEWVNSQTKVAPLKKALKLLELDGNYYTDLIKAVEEKLVSIDPKYTKCICLVFKFSIWSWNWSSC